MRRFNKFPVGPDVLSLVAVIALVTIVYLCSLPETFHSLSHRKANAAELMGHARELIVKEGDLFTALMRAADEQGSAKIRQHLVDNERTFHDIASEFSSELPEATNDIESMVSLFDHLAASGWRAAAAAPQSPPEERETLLDGNFAKALEELRGSAERIELSLQRHDAALRSQAVRPAAKGTVSI
ncbi:MAG TPA: hypothetical protein VKP60_00195 [Magnetospirillaceae bacterium]|nr:hypothetical protein [Magnetospirillaceae bacterium]